MSPRKQVPYSSHPNRAARIAHARGAEQFKTYDTSYINPKSNTKPMAVILIAFLVLIIAIFGVARGCMSGPAHQLVEAGQEVSITIPEGSTAGAIGELLAENGLVAHASEFTDAVNRSNAAADLKPGQYIFVGGTSTEDLVAHIAAGPQSEAVTIPEGKTVHQTAQIVSDATEGRISADDFKALAANAKAYEADYDFVKDAYDNSLEGFLFPKTYELGPDDDADALIRKMLDQYRIEVETLDYSDAASKNLTQYEVLILASIIEREAGSDHRETVSSVFYNRMSGGMPLQSDATVAYLIDGDPTPEDLEKDSPYNTYLNYGLPAGPICSPSLASLQAACKPDTTDFLYFYFEPDSEGKMQYYFSVTYDEHQDAIVGNGVPYESPNASASSSSASAAEDAQADTAEAEQGEADSSEADGETVDEGAEAPAGEGQAAEGEGQE